MKVIPDETIKVTVELNKKELVWLESFTKVSGEYDPTKADIAIRLSFYVMASRALGYRMNDDGSVPR